METEEQKCPAVLPLDPSGLSHLSSAASWERHCGCGGGLAQTIGFMTRILSGRRLLSSNPGTHYNVAPLRIQWPRQDTRAHTRANKVRAAEAAGSWSPAEQRSRATRRSTSGSTGAVGGSVSARDAHQCNEDLKPENPCVPR
ncbi:unnamed protein product [Pleuronectes platessa]|uniref:Uncharacterized protein n=1 Tax=Pleuronectes platessa TaxID=8262 RepID=A0A9N7U8E7_PLEPL|nr:unnamed protein product [Pleuronectes platessa]